MVGLDFVVVVVVDDFSDTPAPAPPLPEMLPEFGRACHFAYSSSVN